MSAYTFYEIIRYASIFSVVPCIIQYASEIRKTNEIRKVTKPFHFIGILTIASFLSDLVSLILLYYKKQQFIPIFQNVYFLIQFTLLSLFYIEILFKKNHKTYLVAMLIHCLLSIVIVMLFAQDVFKYQGLMRAISSITMFVYGILYFKNQFGSLDSNKGILRINAGISLYFGLNLWVFLLMEPKLFNPSIETATVVWIFHNINNITKNILFAIGIYYSNSNHKG